MSGDKGKSDTGSDAGWSNVQSNKSFNQNKRWTGKTDKQVKQDIETRKETRARETEFQNYNKPPVEYTGPSMTIKVLNWVGNKVGQSKFAKDTNLKNRTFFTDKVLSKKGVYDGNKKLSKSEFQSLSLEKQNEIYGNFMDDRMAGRTDAYGNPIGGNRRETIKHKNKDGTYTTKSVWMGGNDNNNNQQVTLTNQQITQQTEEADKAEAEVKITEEEYKKRRGLIGSRSMFGNAGGRGYFDPA
jgi:hypothetical protein